jgi:hypothetical protein
MRRLSALLLGLLVPFAGCEVEPDDAEATCDAEMRSFIRDTETPDHYVISALTFARRVDGAVKGFDLDGEENGCGHADLPSPEGEPGIDNNFAALVPVLESTEAVAAESLVAQSISAGELMLTISLAGVDDWMEDTCVDFTLGRAEGVPLVSADGSILDLQTLAPHSEIPSVDAPAVASDMRIDAEGLTFDLPLDILNAELNFQVERGHFRVQRRWDGSITGVMGGVIPIVQITEILERDDVNLQQFVPLVTSVADVEDENGNCTQLSLAFEFVATPVYLSDATPE